MMNRRSFLAGFAATAAGVLVPTPEPVRAYSFVGGWALGVDPAAPDSERTVISVCDPYRETVRVRLMANGEVLDEFEVRASKLSALGLERLDGFEFGHSVRIARPVAFRSHPT